MNTVCILFMYSKITVKIHTDDIKTHLHKYTFLTLYKTVFQQTKFCDAVQSTATPTIPLIFLVNSTLFYLDWEKLFLVLSAFHNNIIQLQNNACI